jgi:hypothetical protein
MKSSSTPPAVVTMAETCLCCTRYRSVSRRPDEIRLDVYPRKMVVPSLVSGSLHARCHLLAGTRGAWARVRQRGYFRPTRFEFTAPLAWAARRLSPRSNAAAAATATETEATHHVIDDAHCFPDRRCLEAHARVACDELLDSDAAVRILIEVDAPDLFGVCGHGLRGLQDRIGGARGGCSLATGRHGLCCVFGRDADGRAGEKRLFWL